MAHLGPLSESERRWKALREAERPRRLELHRTCEIPDYDTGKIVCFKSDRIMNLDPPPSKMKKSLFTKRTNPLAIDVDHTDIGLYNSVDELILLISIRRQEGVLAFNSRASRNLHHGWGPEETVKIAEYRGEISRSDRILVYDLGEKFQVIFGLTTVYYFAKRFKDGTPKKASYKSTVADENPINFLLSRDIFISVFNLSDLPAYEKEIIERQWKSSIAAIQWHDEIRLYYQVHPNAHLDQNSDVVRELRKASPAAPWAHGATIERAAKNSSIAAVVWIEDGMHIRVYYRDPGLHLREHCQDTATLSGTSVFSHANSLSEHGSDPSRSPISAEVVHERMGYVRISPSWKDAESKIVNVIREISSRISILRDDIQVTSGNSLGMMDGSG
ncbi:hypothetical protein M413DRAFT_423029 [Hebeloma cylindrosporum]|uniref:Galectin domain-containing protein n=1 Tax=Hebeloma cylindrosporum TaxID=76867 RepID=A0A0C3CES0_HEBCY|nr:hypothetical protein M413DRAFT_423029 [Hebeloma cylindrosporum h7]